ncbi:MAG: TRAP transporter small permease [Hyphomicrobiaceae bacterium]|nr:TRAP transporter small permease [Hyphomicrobiaceae bacterium]
MAKLLEQIEFWLGVTILAIITGLVFVAAVMRFFGTPLIWSVDLAQLLFIWLCFFGAARAMRQRGHLGVDFLARLLPHKGRLVLETLLSLVFIAFMIMLAIEGYQLTFLNLERQFGDSGLSYAWVTIAVPVGCVLLSLVLLLNMIEAWRKRGPNGPLIFSRTETEIERTQALG